MQLILTAHLVSFILAVTFLLNVRGQESVNEEAQPLTNEIDAGGTSEKLLCEVSLGQNLCQRLATGCYCIVQQQLTWQAAFQFCRANGKSLLSVNSIAKQFDLQNNLPNLVGTNNIVTQVGVWTSGTYIQLVDAFIWASTGEFFTFGHWQMYSPRFKGPNDCVRLAPTDSCNWADVDCGQYLPFICESP